MNHNIQSIGVFVTFAVLVSSFPDGAPPDTCVKERFNQPNHGQYRAQPLETLPYSVFASSAFYQPGDSITRMRKFTAQKSFGDISRSNFSDGLRRWSFPWILLPSPQRQHARVGRWVCGDSQHQSASRVRIHHPCWQSRQSERNICLESVRLSAWTSFLYVSFKKVKSRSRRDNFAARVINL